MEIVDSVYVIQDCIMRARIGADRLMNGIYHFSNVHAFHVSVSSLDLIHKHLGHLSYFVMHHLKNFLFDYLFAR